ncbi:glucan biosynthesis protein G [Rhodoferax fermentans]|uniref:glucan biosynthesis protein G n=1 Tax=Rhodoferax fermentans TaxID=28066 RepID=UPI0009927A2E|nr:glucan biosynthesis protein G [Rhodoferax fermentans]MBK1683571.1 glucan biosynthesis protein D [Rhodoferax fermentans]
MPSFFHPSFQRRTAAVSTQFVALLVAGLLTLAADQAQAWGLDDVAALARTQAQAPFKPAKQAMPSELANLDYDGYRDIRFNPDRNLWRADKLPYEANFFHVGRLSDIVRLNEITAQGVKPIPYNPADFNYGQNKLSPQTWGDLGFGGLRTFSNLNTAEHKDELVVFSGASYFRALGAGQRYGLSARGLAVDTSGAAPEEFPRFTEFWLEKPTNGAKQLTIYALMDSARMTGAYRFDITPGEQTVTEVHARVFMRATDKPVATLGLAPLTSMFFFGENQPRKEDFRPEVHDSDGLMIATGEGEWLWRPLQNPGAAITTSFSMKSLKGFGLMQRDRAFHNYEDTEARYELRPSAWVTPLGDWGPGRVELLQFGIPDETHDNVAAYWVPANMPQPGQSIDFAYTIHWQGQNQQLPPNGWVTQSRRGTGYLRPGAEVQDQHQFVLDFAGPALDALPEGAPVQAMASTNANGRVIESLAYKNPVTGAWRMTLRVQRLNPALPVELRAFLQHNQQTLSETWTNLITP